MKNKPYKLKYHQCHDEVKRRRLLHYVSHRQCHGKVHGIDYSTSLFSVSNCPLRNIKRLRLLQFLIWCKLSSMPR